jgi:transketolase
MGGGFEYGSAGPTHYGLEDVGAMRLLQGVAVVVPADAEQATTCVRALSAWPGPAYLRLGKNDKQRVPGLDGRFELGRVQEVREGSEVVVFAMGAVGAAAAEAVAELETTGISVTLAVIASVNPCPADDIARLVATHRLAVTVEAHVAVGGIGSLVAESIAATDARCRLVRIAVDEPYGRRGGGEGFLHEMHGLSPGLIAGTVRSAVAHAGQLT